MKPIENLLSVAVFTAIVFWFSMQANAQIQTTFTEPIVSSELASSENGIITKIHVKEGEYVNKGSVIAEMDQEVIKISLQYAKAKAGSSAAIERANARVKATKQKYESLAKLDRNGHANQRELQLSIAEYEEALADLQMASDEQQMAQIEVARIEAQLEQRLIRCPFDGSIIKIHKSLGEYISANEPQFATLVVLQELRARFYLLDSQTRGLKVKDLVEVEVGQEKVQARVEFVSPIIDADSRTVRVEVVIDNRNNGFACGVPCSWIGSKSMATRQDPNSKTR